VIIDVIRFRSVISIGEESTCNAGDLSLIPVLGRSPGEGNGNTPVFLLGKPDGQRILTSYSPRGHKSQTRLSD